MGQLQLLNLEFIANAYIQDGAGIHYRVSFAIIALGVSFFLMT